ncbi:MAG: cytochrome [Marmoricola sp.]|nr:cytochrome [Marmoricola sp.]
MPDAPSAVAPSRPARFGLIDHSPGLLRHGYRFWESLRARRASEVIQTRLLHERVTVIRGPAAAQFFYEEQDTERSSALPKSLVGSLFGQGPVHTLDGSAHAHRKAMFNTELNDHAAADIVADVAQRWDAAAESWTKEIDVFKEIAQILFEAGCRWLGLAVSDVSGRTRDMIAMVDGFGAPTGRQLRARRARRRTNRWVMEQIASARRSQAAPHSVVAVVAAHRDERGELLDERTAAVEVINMLRPLVAVSWLIQGLARAYDDSPRNRDDVLSGHITPMEMAQEVRRCHPFVPFLATRPTRDLTWDGWAIPARTLLVIDVWGTNHDPSTWPEPMTFDPSRFRKIPVTPYNLIPQGGGDRHGGHRCPGEDLTLAILTTVAPRVAALRGRIEGDRPGLRRMPPRPRCVIHVDEGAA